MPYVRNPSHLHLVSPASTPQQSDVALVHAMRAQSERAAVDVWERYSALVRRILQRTLGPSIEVDDAVQESFLRLFRDIGKLRNPDALRSFLIGITLHVAASELRRRRAKRWLLLSDDGTLPEANDTTDTPYLEQREALRRFYRLLDGLDTRHRLVFVLRYVEGMEIAELSAIMGCSHSTIKRRTANAAQRVNRLAAKDPVLAPYMAREN